MVCSSFLYSFDLRCSRKMLIILSIWSVSKKSNNNNKQQNERRFLQITRIWIHIGMICEPHSQPTRQIISICLNLWQTINHRKIFFNFMFHLHQLLNAKRQNDRTEHKIPYIVFFSYSSSLVAVFFSFVAQRSER